MKCLQSSLLKLDATVMLLLISDMRFAKSIITLKKIELVVMVYQFTFLRLNLQKHESLLSISL